MILAAHQPNFIPWISFFAKMQQSDVFVLMSHCQWEKNGFQNRCQVNGKWWTKPVNGGLIPIKDKTYTDGQNLLDVNYSWIMAIAKTLSIDVSKIEMDFETEARGTQRLIELCLRYKCDKYLTNPDAMTKYLDESLMNKAGIEVIPFTFPHKLHVFEVFDKFGIEGTINLLNSEKSKCEMLRNSLVI